MDTTTWSALLLASSTRERWPSCSAPMVGTSATLSPAFRHLARRALKSLTVRAVWMGLVMLPLLSTATITKWAYPQVNCYARQRARPSAGPMTGSGGHQVTPCRLSKPAGHYWIVRPAFAGAKLGFAQAGQAGR